MTNKLDRGAGERAFGEKKAYGFRGEKSGGMGGDKGKDRQVRNTDPDANYSEKGEREKETAENFLGISQGWEGQGKSNSRKKYGETSTEPGKWTQT